MSNDIEIDADGIDADGLHLVLEKYGHIKCINWSCSACETRGALNTILQISKNE